MSDIIPIHISDNEPDEHVQVVVGMDQRDMTLLAYAMNQFEIVLVQTVDEFYSERDCEEPWELDCADYRTMCSLSEDRARVERLAAVFKEAMGDFEE